MCDYLCLSYRVLFCLNCIEITHIATVILNADVVL